MSTKTVLTAIVWLHLIGGLAANAQSASFSWERTETSVVLTNADRTVWQFYYGTDKDKPFFHPLCLIDGKTAGIAVFEHPENVDAPTTWYVIDSGLKCFSPAVIFQQPRTLPASESMTLKYRVSVHGGRWNADVLRDKREEYMN